PGEAVLDFQIHPAGQGRTELLQLSRFLPRGLFGILYWYALYPLHQWVFRGMLRAIALSTGGSLLEGPQRFAPGRPFVCRLDPRAPPGKAVKATK
ncbi:MAG: DUF2867 domain-containing protein, partial [Deltaproteobacteria bacterium]|nr:DUF2867 domain-containing protein [Deltaproteobacteria bacterium]